MEHDSLLFPFFLIFSGAALFSTVALSLKQPLLVAYIFLGIAIGPFGLAFISDASLLSDIAEFGIIFCCSCWVWTCNLRTLSPH